MPHQNHHPGLSPALRRQFTLIELLIVIAIVTILAAILLPSLQRARAAAIQTACLSNQRQVYLEWELFRNDHDGMQPPRVAYTRWDSSSPYTFWQCNNRFAYLVHPGDRDRLKPILGLLRR